jgi:hypothetical protein
MPRGVDTGSHPRRQVGAGSGPWTQWANRLPENASAQNRYDPRFPHGLDIQRQPSGKYLASYEHYEPGYQGPRSNVVSTYEVETQFRSPERAKLAAEALANRVTSYRGGSRNYRRQTHFGPGDYD